MRLDLLNALKDPGQAYAFEAPLELPEMIVLDDPVRFESVLFRGTAIGAGETVAIDGTVEAVLGSRCSRCLMDVCQRICAEVHQVFARDPTSAVNDVLSIDAAGVELEPLAAEALLLEMPMRFLCREDCLGICPTCGKNRNEDSCSCQEGGKRQNPFSALSDLLTEDEEV